MDVFKKAVIEGLYFETDRGVLSVCEVAQLPIDELRNLYRELKEVVAVEDDPLLKDESNEQETTLSKNRLRFEVVRELLVYRKEEAKRTKLLQQKKELEQMLKEIQLRKLQEDPEALMAKIKELEEQLAA